MKKYIALILTVLALGAIFAFAASAETFVNPVANGADPFVFKDTDGTYYLYVTSGGAYGYRVYTSTNLVEWEAQGYCLRRDDVYTDDATVNDSGNKIYNFWAPEVIKEGDTYYMVYTAQEHIGIATSDSPMGPFKNDADSYIVSSKAIDGHFFRDDNGKLYLYFVSTGAASFGSDSVTNGNNIWGCEFDLETCSFVGTPKLLVEWDLSYMRDWVVEGPEMLKKDGKYYLTYSASGYTDPAYSVWCATSSSPLGSFARVTDSAVLKSDDATRTDTANPHLYGTAHHCFTTSPDGSEMYIVYHAHRTGTDPNGTGDTVEERRICIDRAWFDGNGVLRAGSNTVGVPSATAQSVPAGGTLTRELHLDGSFAAISTLPTVYVAGTDGNDSAAGTAAAPLKTLEAAYAKLANGGTIVLTQRYSAGTYFDAPAVNGPIMIKGAFSAVPLFFKFISLNSDTYFENIAFFPETANNISVIECNFNNVTMGDGVSCIAQPTRKTFPVLVGGRWWTTTSDTSAVYDNFRYTSTEVVSDKEFALNIYSGTWSIATCRSVKNTTQIYNSTPNAVVNRTGDCKLRNAKPAAPAVKISSEGAVVDIFSTNVGNTFVVYKDGEVAGYTNTLKFVDTEYTVGTSVSYSVADYVNGACISDVSDAVAFSFVADLNGDGAVGISDALLMLSDLVNSVREVSLIDVIVVLKMAVAG